MPKTNENDNNRKQHEKTATKEGTQTNTRKETH